MRLKGTLHMGDPNAPDRAVVDPSKAFASFMLAARFAGPDDNLADILMSAGHAAYAAGQPDKALTVFRDSAGLQQNSRAHFAAARAALHAGKPQAAQDELRRALELEWEILALAAIDPDCISHLEVVEPVLRDFADTKKAEIQDGLGPVCHILCGPSRSNIALARKKLTAADNNLHHDIATFRQKDRFLTEEEQARIKALRTAEIDLLDIRAELRRINARRDDLGYTAVTLSMKLMHTSWKYTEEHLDNIAKAAARGQISTYVGLPNTYFRKVPEPVSPSGLSGLIGMRSGEQRRRDDEIAQIEGENAKNEKILAANKKAMKDIFMPALNEVRRVTSTSLATHEAATRTLIEILGDEEATKDLSRSLPSA